MRKNIILMGANGAGKSTLAHVFYHKGYHMYKLSPLAPDNLPSLHFALTANNLVFDRWGPVDLAIYREEKELLQEAIESVDRINECNIIFYLENYNEYDESFSQYRVVQRPKSEDLFNYIQKYRQYVKVMSEAGIQIYFIRVDEDATKTLKQIEEIIKENEKLF